MQNKQVYIAIDFDGTIVKHAFPEIGDPAPGAFEWMKKFKDAGATLILWTMRSDSEQSGPLLRDACDFCKSNGVAFDFINGNPQDWTTSPKAYAHIYIDDHAFGCPMKDNPDGRNFVDWDIVGPAVLDMIYDRLSA